MFVQTHDEARVVIELNQLSKDMSLSLIKWDTKNGLVFQDGKSDQARTDGVAALELLGSIQQARTLCLMKDFHLQMEKALQKIALIRLLKETFPLYKAKQNMFVFVGARFEIPIELEKEIQILSYGMPDTAVLLDRLHYVRDSVNNGKEVESQLVLSADISDRAVEAARGMTYSEVENAYSLALIENKKFDEGFVNTVYREKFQQVKKTGLLTCIDPDVSFDDIGGLDNLKKWLAVRKQAFTQKAKDYGLPFPKGVLLSGIPGNGKSMLAKATAREFGCPLLQLDVGALFSKLVGATEENFRKVISIVDSFGFCVLLIDEIEKNLSTMATSGAGDSGTSSRSFGTLLTWMSERTSPVFVIATTNNHTILPSALVRKGRFDEAFWLDLPSEEERREIFSVVIKRFKRDPEDFDIASFAASSDQFTGSEIEEVFKSAMYAAFYTDKEVETKHVAMEIKALTPQAQLNNKDIERLREDSSGKLKNASSQEFKDFASGLRKIELET